MNDINLINAGRGAGKTHALIEWAKQQDNRYIVGLHLDTGNMLEAAGLSSKFVHYADAKAFFTDKSGLEIAFDNFESVLPSLFFEEFGVSVYANDVMVSAALPDVSEDFLPLHGIRVLSEEIFGVDYIDRLKKMFTKEDH